MSRISKLINMNNNEELMLLDLRRHLFKVYSTLCLGILCFLLGITLNALSIIESLKVSLIILISFIMIFQFKNPCILQFLSLMSMSLVQGILFSAIFISQKKISVPVLIQCILTTLGLLIACFGIIVNSDKYFKRNLRIIVISSSCILLISVFFIKLVSMYRSPLENKLILLVITTRLLIDIKKASTPSPLQRNYILDAFLISVDIFQIFIRSLLILEHKSQYPD